MSDPVFKAIEDPRRLGGQAWRFVCPACKVGHWVRTGPGQPSWSHTGGLCAPTVQPSVLVHGQNRCHKLAGETHELPPIDGPFDTVFGEGGSPERAPSAGTAPKARPSGEPE